MYALLFIQFIRTRTCQLGLGLVLLLGIVSIITGKQFLNHQEDTVQEVAEKQQEHIDRNVALHNDDLGLLLYYLKFSLVNQHNALAPVSIGQKDLNPTVQSVNMLTLEGQKYDTDLVNPSKLLLGNLDLSFVFIYVFPLLAIAFTYNLRSEEEEAGTWKIVNVMAKSNLRFLVLKLLVRFLLLGVLMGLLYMAASLVLGIPLGEPSVAFFITSILYLLFWFALCFWVIALKRSSNVNALVLLVFWLGLMLLLPAVVNNAITSSVPVPEAYTTFVKQRDGTHEKWDMGKRETMDKFYASYPQLKSFGYPTEEGFTWHWYYAMQHMGDEESRTESEAMKAKVLQREQLSRQWARLVPSMHTQLVFNDIAGTSLLNHLNFLQHTNQFHESTRLYFYPKVFAGETAEAVAWELFGPKYYKEENKPFNWLESLLPLLLGVLLFSALAAFAMRRGI